MVPAGLPELPLGSPRLAVLLPQDEQMFTFAPIEYYYTLASLRAHSPKFSGCDRQRP